MHTIKVHKHNKCHCDGNAKHCVACKYHFWQHSFIACCFLFCTIFGVCHMTIVAPTPPPILCSHSVCIVYVFLHLEEPTYTH